MSSQVKCTFKINSWNEESFSMSKNGPKLNRASVTQTYSGPLKAKSTIEYLMTTFEDDTSTFIGLRRFLGNWKAEAEVSYWITKGLTRMELQNQPLKLSLTPARMNCPGFGEKAATRLPTKTLS